MPPRDLHIFIEGDPRLRPGFAQLFKKALGELCQKRQIILRPMLGGSHSETLKKCLRAAQGHGACVLLLDADAEIAAGIQPRDHYQTLHRCDAITSLHRDQVHMMVVQMEAWLVCDEEAWKTVFGPKFRSNVLPQSADIESLNQKRIMDSIEQATRETPGGPYHKIKHGVRLLEALTPDRVERRAKHFRNFLKYLRLQIDPTATH